MALFRNQYVEVCVYCHTPHGANQLSPNSTKSALPLWNRTINTNQYTIYDKPRTLERPITQPGPNSLTCLSCHDGTISIDSIINMPGSGGYNAAQQDVNTVDNAFLNSWAATGKGAGPQGDHYRLGPSNQAGFDQAPNCTFCHRGDTLPDFTGFVIGTNLKDDHPVGVLFPTEFGPGVDFNQPTAEIPGKMRFFDKNGDGKADTNEVRLYDTGDGYEVECGSCHDPHGVPSDGKGTRFNPSFLRVNNGIAPGSPETALSAGPSALCLTCHLK